MLKDLPEGWLPPGYVTELRHEYHDLFEDTEHLATGVYVTHLNWHIEIDAYVEKKWPFSDELIEHYRRATAGEVDISSFDWSKWAPDYGVCDNYHQILVKYPVIESDPRPFLIYMMLIRREDQPERGGWRWHKWGKYIGTYEPKYEYLYDEDVDQVYVYRIVQLKN